MSGHLERHRIGGGAAESTRGDPRRGKPTACVVHPFVTSHLPPNNFLVHMQGHCMRNSHLKLTRPPICGQGPPKITTVVLLTEDAANRQKAEKSGITSTSGQLPRLSSWFCFLSQVLPSLRVHWGHERVCTAFRSLAAADSEDIEPTKAAGPTTSALSRRAVSYAAFSLKKTIANPIFTP